MELDRAVEAMKVHVNLGGLQAALSEVSASSLIVPPASPWTTPPPIVPERSPAHSEVDATPIIKQSALHEMALSGSHSHYPEADLSSTAQHSNQEDNTLDDDDDVRSTAESSDTDYTDPYSRTDTTDYGIYARRMALSDVSFNYEHVTRTEGLYRLSEFSIHQTLSTGSSGTVHLVRSKCDLRFYTIKVSNKESIVRTRQTKRINDGRLILSRVQHPFIIHLWGAFQDMGHLYMVMEFVPGGELFTLLRRLSRFPEPVAKFYAAGIAMALSYLHNMDIIYRDLKPENILLGADGYIKIADFGFAKLCERDTWTFCGTPDYLAPEIILQRPYNKSVDWYALGVLIYEMLSGLPPYFQADANHMLLYERIVEGPSNLKFSTAFSQNAKDIILKLMEGDTSRRYGNLRHGADDVFDHPWLEDVNWRQLAAKKIPAPYIPNMTGEGDASAYGNHSERNSALELSYGHLQPDLYGQLFPSFEYSVSSSQLLE